MTLLQTRYLLVPYYSIENFKRDKEEVQSLFDLFREKIRLLIAEEKKLAEHGVRVKIIGKYTSYEKLLWNDCARPVT